MLKTSDYNEPIIQKPTYLIEETILKTPLHLKTFVQPYEQSSLLS